MQLEMKELEYAKHLETLQKSLKMNDREMMLKKKLESESKKEEKREVSPKTNIKNTISSGKKMLSRLE